MKLETESNDELKCAQGDIYNLINFLIMELKENKKVCAEVLANRKSVICWTNKYKFILTVEKRDTKSEKR